MTDSRNALLESQMWFLFTDGAISEQEVENFARSIDEHVLHNRASACVLFGYRAASPSQCNISVGMSTYGMVPDSLFLFHDIRTAEVYVLFAKGCFTYLGETNSSRATIDDTTLWSDLPSIDYKDLARSVIPLPRDLSRNEVLPHNGDRLDLNCFAENSLAPQEVDQILSSPDDLSAVVASLKTLGRSDEFLAWTEQQSRSAQERQSKRHDSANAEGLVKEILSALKNKKSATKVKNLQQRLRKAHLLNWKPLLGSQDYETRKQAALQLSRERMLLMRDTGKQSSASSYTPLASPMSMAASSAQHDIVDFTDQTQTPQSRASRFRQSVLRKAFTKSDSPTTEPEAITRLRKTITSCPGLEIKEPFPLPANLHLSCLVCGD